MTSSLVGSEMCIRDRPTPSTALVESWTWARAPSSLFICYSLTGRKRFIVFLTRVYALRCVVWAFL
eukprot:7396679-Prorocentrum_lima.AAC.1